MTTVLTCGGRLPFIISEAHLLERLHPLFSLRILRFQFSPFCNSGRRLLPQTHTSGLLYELACAAAFLALAPLGLFWRSLTFLSLWLRLIMDARATASARRSER